MRKHVATLAPPQPTPPLQVFLSLCHMTACLCLGCIISASGWIPIKPLKGRAQLSKVAILAAIFCSTIVMGNASLKWVVQVVVQWVWRLR